ncbi:MAG: hypothetical protein R3231_07635 [bacterium]|nr:hypothetical protein [bacterium]
MYTEPDRTSYFLVIVIILLIAGLATYFYVERDRVARWLSGDVIEQEKEELQEKIVSLEEEIATLKEEIELEAKPPSVPEERLEEVFGPDGDAAVPADKEKGEPAPAEETVVDPRVALKKRIENFCSYLDSRDYVQAYGLETGVFEHFKALLPRLLENPPVVVRETDDLLRVLQNSAHFFRVLGKDNVLLIRDILKQDGDIMEPTLAMMYEVIRQGSQKAVGSEDPGFQIPLNDAYEYAAFFLNTLGGRSYLMRRDSRVRTLAQYYSVLIVDMANDRVLNRWGIDVREPLDTVISDIEGSANLDQRKKYLRTLKKLERKYEKLYGQAVKLSLPGWV